MASDLAIDPSRQAGGPAAHRRHARGAQCVVLSGANGMRVADAAQGLSAEGHGVLLLQELSAGRHLGTDACLNPQPGSREGWQEAAAQRRDPRQSIGQNHGKKGACCGYDAGKKVKGRNRHLLVDTLGLIWGLVVHGADVQDRDGAKLVLKTVTGKLPKLKLLWADGGYAGQL